MNMLTWARNRKCAAWVLWCLWGLGALPPVVLAIEFWGLDLGDCDYEAWYYARLYSHMFIYPVTFGIASTLFLTRPFVEAVDYLFYGRKKQFAVVVASILLILLIACALEFCRATESIWAFSPEALQDTPSGIRARDILENRCQATRRNLTEPSSAYPDALAAEDPYNVYLNELSFSELLENLEEEVRSPPWAELWWWDKTSEWKKIHSSTNIAYHFGFVSRFALFMILFMTIFVAVTAGEVGQRMMHQLTYALIFASFWALMRITFMVEKYDIDDIEKDPLFIYNLIIFGVFLIGYVYLFTFATDRVGTTSDKLNQILLSVFGIIKLLLGSTGFTNWMPKILILLFGTGSSPWTYIIIGLFMFVIFFPNTLRFFGCPRQVA